MASQITLTDGHVYDTWTRNPVHVVTSETRYTLDRVPSIDRRLADCGRATLTDFEGSGYEPGFFHPTRTELSYASPLRTPAIQQIVEFFEAAGHLTNCKVQIAGGPAWFAQRKILRVRNDIEGPLVPHSIWLSVLAQYPQRVRAWATMVPNIKTATDWRGCLVSVRHVEATIGFNLWQHINDDGFQSSKNKIQTAWW